MPEDFAGSVIAEALERSVRQMKLKKVFSAALLAAAMAINVNAIDLYVDAVKLEPEVPPTVIEGHTLVPLRSIFDAIGAELEWDNSTQTATGRRGDSTLSIQIGSPTASVNGEEKTLEAPAQIINGSTMVPARFVAEGLNCIVQWDQATDGIYISTTGAEPVIPKAAPSAPEVAPSVPEAAPSVSEAAPSGGGSTGGGGSGNGNNFNTYDNKSQQETSDTYVLNKSSHKFHYPSCRSVPKISPKNYATSSSSRDSLIAQGYSSCGICNP